MQQTLESMAAQVSAGLMGKGYSCEIREGHTVDVGLMVLMEDKYTRKNVFERVSVLHARITEEDLTKTALEVITEVDAEIRRYAEPFNVKRFMEENSLEEFEDIKNSFEEFMTDNSRENYVTIGGEIRLKPDVSTMLWMMHSTALSDATHDRTKRNNPNYRPKSLDRFRRRSPRGR